MAFGLGSIVGGIGGFLIGGPGGAKIGASLGGSFDAAKSAKDERRRALRDQDTQFLRMRAAAERAGFNPLTVLESTGGGGFANVPSGVAPLASAAAIQGVVSDVSDIFSGETAKQAKRQETADRINELRLEQMQAGDAGRIIQRTGRAARTETIAPVTTNMPYLGAEFKPGPLGAYSISKGTDSIGPPKINTPEDVRREHEGPLRLSYTRKDGSIIEIPAGPDIDEVMTGVVMENVEQWENIGNAISNTWQGAKGLTMWGQIGAIKDRMEGDPRTDKIRSRIRRGVDYLTQ